MAAPALRSRSRAIRAAILRLLKDQRTSVLTWAATNCSGAGSGPMPMGLQASSFIRTAREAGRLSLTLSEPDVPALGRSAIRYAERIGSSGPTVPGMCRDPHAINAVIAGARSRPLSVS